MHQLSAWNNMSLLYGELAYVENEDGWAALSTDTAKTLPPKPKKWENKSAIQCVLDAWMPGA